MTEIDNYSRSTIPITQFFRDIELGTATGFVWRHHGVNHLITNWHVVTMIDRICFNRGGAHGGQCGGCRT